MAHVFLERKGAVMHQSASVKTVCKFLPPGCCSSVIRNKGEGGEASKPAIAPARFVYGSSDKGSGSEPASDSEDTNVREHIASFPPESSSVPRTFAMKHAPNYASHRTVWSSGYTSGSSDTKPVKSAFKLRPATLQVPGEAGVRKDPPEADSNGVDKPVAKAEEDPPSSKPQQSRKRASECSDDEQHQTKKAKKEDSGPETPTPESTTDSTEQEPRRIFGMFTGTSSEEEDSRKGFKESSEPSDAAPPENYFLQFQNTKSNGSSAAEASTTAAQPAEPTPGFVFGEKLEERVVTTPKTQSPEKEEPPNKEKAESEDHENYFLQFSATSSLETATTTSPSTQTAPVTTTATTDVNATPAVFGQKAPPLCTVTTVSPTSGAAAPSFIFGQNMNERVVSTCETSLDKDRQSLSDSHPQSPAPAEDEQTTTSEPTSPNFSDLSKKSVETTATSPAESATKPDNNVQRLLESAARYQESRTSSMDFAEVEKVTGEEGERNVMQCQCRLFLFNKTSQSWQERGRGCLRLNDLPTQDDGSFQSRMVMRSQGSLRLLMNCKLWPRMVVEQASKRSVRVTCMDQDRVNVYLIMASPKDASQLFTAIEYRVQILKRREERHVQVQPQCEDSVGSEQITAAAEDSNSSVEDTKRVEGEVPEASAESSAADAEKEAAPSGPQTTSPAEKQD
ncbi:PREDICTED: ran-binding protein 3-like isoform X7 [Branchiostoma belcheri]|uniref:Ran-binding protein 3-like isoform X7 n=1 Tax=Branchiostoma belcheri TaxID=7741 RepID=A0A6P5ARA5_BRABE|nr:PREDICTED: ran-binding protein 3-like isoform X7 [Branchiostoma belcheri]